MRTYPVGFLFSSTGPYEVVGRAMLNGAVLASEEINAQPGATTKLQPFIADPGGELAHYPPLCSKLLDAGIRHVAGCYTSSSRKELIPLVEKRDALLWYPSHYEGFESSSNVVYTGAVPNQHIVPLIGYALEQCDRKIFCVGSNYLWAWENNRILRELLPAHGGTIIAERYMQIGERDFSKVIDAIIRVRPDFVFTTLIGSSAYEFFGAFRGACAMRGIDQARSMPLLSCSLSEAELAEIVPEAQDGHISSSVYFSSFESPENRRFVASYERRFPHGPAVCADAEASYVAVHLLAMALAEAQTDEIAAVAAAACRQVMRAPQGEVRLDPSSMHAYLTPRIGRSRADGRFEILQQATSPVAPDPYLVRSMSESERAALPRLRLVS